MSEHAGMTRQKGDGPMNSNSNTEGIKFYIGSEDPGAHGNPGLVLYRTLTAEEKAEAKEEGSHNEGEPWSMWLTEDVLHVAEASGLLDESIGCSAEKAREWLRGDAKVDQIRKQLAYLEGELARLSGEPLVIYDQHGDAHDAPEGGAFLDYSPAIAEYGFRHWYPATEAAKAALLKMARESNCVPSKDGLHVDLSPAGAQYSTTAWVTRR